MRHKTNDNEEGSVPLLGPDERPVEEPPAEEKNGEDAKRKEGWTDVRFVPTGQLIFNLCMCVGMVESAAAQLTQIDMMLKEQRMVVAPPQIQNVIDKLTAEGDKHLAARNKLVLELDQRFKHADEAYWAENGLEIYRPKEG